MSRYGPDQRKGAMWLPFRALSHRAFFRGLLGSWVDVLGAWRRRGSSGPGAPDPPLMGSRAGGLRVGPASVILLMSLRIPESRLPLCKMGIMVPARQDLLLRR